ncbi:hypothetical protein L1049_023892 [Liquidambar formosana]|uniref:Uncharacterized protein n=1 Tax=Liquidambar formosana TaxID=63359 RepID=A0AAP0RZD5_LIQFO
MNDPKYAYPYPPQVSRLCVAAASLTSVAATPPSSLSADVCNLVRELFHFLPLLLYRLWNVVLEAEMNDPKYAYPYPPQVLRLCVAAASLTSVAATPPSSLSADVCLPEHANSRLMNPKFSLVSQTILRNVPGQKISQAGLDQGYSNDKPSL